jgi:NADH-quinone oxidoreductase subunit L
VNPWPVVLLPAVAALLGLFAGQDLRDQRLAKGLAVGASAAAFALTLVAWVSGGDALDAPGPALSAGELTVPLSLLSDPTRLAVSAVVALVALGVQVYSSWYLRTDDRYPRFAATVSLFTAAMLLVVHSGDLVLTVVGWEVMGWCSYLLIGHWSRRHSARRAAHKAFLVTRIADIGFVLGMVGLAAGAGTTNLTEVVDTWSDADAGGTLRGILITLVVIGVLGKSAQLPFQDWLADAMEGPTPASALIHAATMVAAGTVVLAGLFPLLAVSPLPRWVLGISVSLTMLLAAVLAFAQSDLKRLLAWSTVSQVGVMLSALAAAPLEEGPDAGLFHLWSHAIFKALLFLAIGWAAVIAGGTAASALRGSAVAVPLLRVSFLFGLLSLAGVPLVVGGLSKEHVIAASWHGAVESGPGVVTLVALLVTVAVTAAYCTRAYLLVTAHVRAPMTAPQRPAAAPLPTSVEVVLGGLVVLSAAGGLVLFTDAFEVGAASLFWIALTLLIIGVGVAAALRGGLDRDPAQVLVPRLMPHADAGLGADALYRAAVASPVLALARLVAFLDTEVVDLYVRGTAVLTRAAGLAGARAHHGERPSSAVGLVLAAVVVLGVVGVLAW